MRGVKIPCGQPSCGAEVGWPSRRGTAAEAAVGPQKRGGEPWQPLRALNSALQASLWGCGACRWVVDGFGEKRWGRWRRRRGRWRRRDGVGGLGDVVRTFRWQILLALLQVKGSSGMA